MIDQLPVGWLVDQQVPLLFFLVALLTSPATWTEKARCWLSKICGRFWPGQATNNKDGAVHRSE